MISISQVIAYALVVFVGAVAPGADFAIVSRHAAQSGRRAGLAAAAGIAGGLLVNATAAVLGMATVLLASPTLYATIKLLGAGYLFYLGASVLWSVRPRRGREADLPGVEDGGKGLAPQPQAGTGGENAVAVEAVVTATTPVVAFRQAFLTNLLNPKPIIFLVTLMPQFLPDDPNAASRVILVLVTAIAAFSWFALVALVFSAFARFFAIPRAALTVAVITGLMLVGIGAWFAITTLVELTA